MIELALPFPPRALNPNARVHWRQKAAAAAQYIGWRYFDSLVEAEVWETERDVE